MLQKITFSLFALLSFFLLSNKLDASVLDYDPDYALEIGYCSGSVKAPSISNDCWKSTNYIYFEDGFWVIISRDWNYESQAKEMSEISFTGYANLLHYCGDYLLAFNKKSDLGYYLEVDYVWINNDSSLADSYRLDSRAAIVNITEIKEINSGWFYDEVKYLYIIELSDGTQWMTQEFKKQWTPWNTGDTIIKVGTHQNPIFINSDNSSSENDHFIRSKDLLTHLKRIN